MNKLTALLALILAAFVATPSLVRDWWNGQPVRVQILTALPIAAIAVYLVARLAITP